MCIAQGEQGEQGEQREQEEWRRGGQRGAGGGADRALADAIVALQPPDIVQRSIEVPVLVVEHDESCMAKAGPAPTYKSQTPSFFSLFFWVDTSAIGCVAGHVVSHGFGP